MRRIFIVLLVAGAGCTGVGAEDASRLQFSSDGTLPLAAPMTSGRTVAMLDDRGHFAVVAADSGEVLSDGRGWNSRLSLDGNYAVSTVVVGDGDTKVGWTSVADGELLGGTIFEGDELESSATELGGHLAAFVNPAAPVEGAIAGARSTSTVVIASPTDGELWRAELDGNFVPEAFGQRRAANGLPTQLFLLEYFPAEAPRFYRVRVLSTETGELSLPVNLRNKAELVDERMAGFTRSQVVAEEHGLLFTLYRGTIDGTPDGDAYAFVHTLGLEDGVWCLSVDPELQLESRPGTLAVGGDRLYVASANGKVGSFQIPSLSDPEASASMSWVTQVTFGGDDAPVALADEDGVYLGYGDDHLVRLDAGGGGSMPRQLPGAGPTAVTRDQDGAIQAIGPDWSTIDTLVRPSWLGPVVQLVVSENP